VLGIFRKPVFRHNPKNQEKSGTTQNLNSLIIVLDNIQDPGNLGTIIRCADWFGVTQVICSPGSADHFNPKVVQSTMASIARVEVLYTDLVKFLTDQRRKNIPIYAAALEGKSIDEFSNIGSGVLIIGNESRGISPEVLSLATDLITIPRYGRAESLNAAIATGIILSRFAAK